MEPYRIILFPDPVLLRPAKPADEGKVKAGLYDEIVDRMIVTMSSNHGAGLAAPQVDIGLAIFVLDNDGLAPRPPIVAFNPSLHSPKGMEEADEGCLSLPGIFAPVSRPAEIVLEASGRDGGRFSVTLSGMTARAAMHEYDHLQGIIFLQRVKDLPSLRLYRHLSSLRKSTA
jgi:peptide deformylase